MPRPILVATLLLLLLAPASAQEPAAPGAPDPDAALRALLEASKADASKIRGLGFLSEVPVRRITPADLKEQLTRDIARIFGEGESLANMETLLKLLRVLPPDTGLVGLLDRFFPESVAANYDTIEKQISFMKGFRSKSIMVHELTHALQDQHFNLEQIVRDGELTFDRLLALGALVEGDAENVQRTFDTNGALANLPLPTIRFTGQMAVESYLARKKDFPRAIARPFIFQYLDGLLFVETVKRERGGFPAVDRMYRDPPLSTEQILHPERYLDRDPPTRILAPAPPAPYRVLVSNSLGELGLSLVLSEHLGKDYQPAMADGWDGDRVLLLAAEGRDPLLAWYTTWDTDEDAVAFVEALKVMMVRRRLDAGAGSSSFAIRRRGADVLLLEGFPKDEEEAILDTLMKAEKSQIVVEKTAFGAAK